MGQVGKREHITSQVAVFLEPLVINVQDLFKFFLAAVVLDPLLVKLRIESEAEDKVGAGWVEAVLLGLEPLFDSGTFKCPGTNKVLVALVSVVLGNVAAYLPRLCDIKRLSYYLMKTALCI